MKSAKVKDTNAFMLLSGSSNANLQRLEFFKDSFITQPFGLIFPMTAIRAVELPDKRINHESKRYRVVKIMFDD